VLRPRRRKRSRVFRGLKQEAQATTRQEVAVLLVRSVGNEKEEEETKETVRVKNEQRKLRKAQRKEQEKLLKSTLLEANALAVEAEEEEKRELKRVVAEKKKEEKETRRTKAQAVGLELSLKRELQSAENELEKIKKDYSTHAKSDGVAEFETTAGKPKNAGNRKEEPSTPRGILQVSVLSLAFHWQSL